MTKVEKMAEAIVQEFIRGAGVLPSHVSGDVYIMAGAIARVLCQPEKSVVKVKRTEDAKQFPIIHIKKHGDVGYDLPAVLPYRDEWQDKDVRVQYMIRRLEDAGLGMLPTGDKRVKEFRTQIERDIFRHYIIVRPCGRCEIPTGIFLELPEDRWATINGRSSTSREMLIAPDGVIDEGYRGELFAVLMNVGSETQTIKHGDRKVQLIIHRRENSDTTIEEVDELSESERGATGFGSTGK